jgi:hypothetical protein
MLCAVDTGPSIVLLIRHTFLLSSSAMMQPRDHMSTAVEYSFWPAVRSTKRAFHVRQASSHATTLLQVDVWGWQQ